MNETDFENSLEFQQTLSTAISQGWCVAALIDGEVKYFHRDNFPPALSTLSIREVAELEGWDWWFAQN